MTIEEMIAAKEARKKELAEKSKASTDINEVRSINSQIDALNTDIVNLRGMAPAKPATPVAPVAAPVAPGAEEQRSKEIQEAEARKVAAAGGTKLDPIATMAIGTGTQAQGTDEARAKEYQQKLEQRGADLKDKKPVTYGLHELPIARSITIATSGLVIPTQYSNTLNPTFNEVSSLVDLVSAIPMTNGETYEKGFEKPSTELAAYTTDGTDYHDTDFITDYVTIAKAALTAYTEISRQAQKLPNVDYQSMCSVNVRKAIRKKLAREIILGDGGAGHFTGIFNAPVNVIPVAPDLEVSEIDADTLDKIVFGYGGDEDVESPAYLILNKSDLAAFAAIRGTDGKKLYTIKTSGNTGTISSNDSFSVNYVLNSNCPALSLSGTTAGTYCMAYGIPAYYEMPVFSDITISMSTDYKFKQGMTAFAGDCYAGGNVAAWKGFERIKKA